ncbi:MAG: hypothetical protein ACFCD0_21425 [Gemmataceae bacterium]
MRPAGRWEVRVELRVCPTTGKRLRKSGYAKTKKQAQEKLRELQAEYRGEIIASDAANRTLKEYLNDWLQASDVAPKTRARYETCVRLHVVPHVGHVRLDKLKPTHVHQLAGKLQDVGSRTRQLTIVTLKSAVKLGILKNNPADGIDVPKHVKEEVLCCRAIQRLRMPIFVKSSTT